MIVIYDNFLHEDSSNEVARVTFGDFEGGVTLGFSFTGKLGVVYTGRAMYQEGYLPITIESLATGII